MSKIHNLRMKYGLTCSTNQRKKSEGGGIYCACEKQTLIAAKLGRDSMAVELAREARGLPHSMDLIMLRRDQYASRQQAFHKASAVPVPDNVAPLDTILESNEDTVASSTDMNAQALSFPSPQASTIDYPEPQFSTGPGPEIHASTIDYPEVQPQKMSSPEVQTEAGTSSEDQSRMAQSSEVSPPDVKSLAVSSPQLQAATDVAPEVHAQATSTPETQSPPPFEEDTDRAPQAQAATMSSPETDSQSNASPEADVSPPLGEVIDYLAQTESRNVSSNSTRSNSVSHSGFEQDANQIAYGRNPVWIAPAVRSAVRNMDTIQAKIVSVRRDLMKELVRAQRAADASGRAPSVAAGLACKSAISDLVRTTTAVSRSLERNADDLSQSAQSSVQDALHRAQIAGGSGAQ